MKTLSQPNPSTLARPLKHWRLIVATILVYWLGSGLGSITGMQMTFLVPSNLTQNLGSTPGDLFNLETIAALILLPAMMLLMLPFTPLCAMVTGANGTMPECILGAIATAACCQLFVLPALFCYFKQANNRFIVVTFLVAIFLLSAVHGWAFWAGHIPIYPASQ